MKLPEDITLRDYFVAHIVEGILSNEFETLELFKGKTKEEAVKDLANAVYKIADALIAEKQRREGKKGDD